jgi:hypothetical protein
MKKLIRFAALTVGAAAFFVSCELLENTCLECEASQVTTVAGDTPVTVPIGPLELCGTEVDSVLAGPFTQTTSLGGVSVTQVTTWTCQ